MKQFITTLLSLALLICSCTKDRNKAGLYTVDNERSTIAWKGYLANDYFNNGTFSVEASTVETRNGKIEGGSFVIPILSLNVLNLTGDLKAQLEAHLKSPDFFNVLLHPNAYFEITKVQPYSGTSEGQAVEGANSYVTGNFTMLGVTKSISFPAKIMMNNKSLEVEARFGINRLDWGMNYASDPAAGEHYIKPVVDLELELYAEKS